MGILPERNLPNEERDPDKNISVDESSDPVPEENGLRRPRKVKPHAHKAPAAAGKSAAMPNGHPGPDEAKPSKQTFLAG
jgi:hypothetical protein